MRLAFGCAMSRLHHAWASSLGALACAHASHTASTHGRAPQICLALKHVHDRKILHRDLKSQNIFLTARQKVPESFSRVRASACAIVHRALSVCLRLSTPIS